MPTMTRRHKRAAVLAASALALLLAVAGSACSSSSSSGSTTSTATGNADAAVTQTLQGWAEAFSRAKTDPAGDHRELLRYGTAVFVREQHTFFDKLIGHGWRAARPPDSKDMFKVVSVTVNGPHATARTCSVDDLNVIDLRSGAVVERQTATTTESWTLERNGSRWLINGTSVQDVSAGVRPCPTS